MLLNTGTGLGLKVAGWLALSFCSTTVLSSFTLEYAEDFFNIPLNGGFVCAEAAWDFDCDKEFPSAAPSGRGPASPVFVEAALLVSLTLGAVDKLARNASVDTSGGLSFRETGAPWVAAAASFPDELLAADVSVGLDSSGSALTGLASFFLMTKRSRGAAAVGLFVFPVDDSAFGAGWVFWVSSAVVAGLPPTSGRGGNSPPQPNNTPGRKRSGFWDS